MAKVDVKCLFCGKTKPVKKHGQGKAKHQRYRCQICIRTFHLDYACRACQHSMKEQIVDLAMNNAGIRDTTRALHLNINAAVLCAR